MTDVARNGVTYILMTSLSPETEFRSFVAIPNGKRYPEEYAATLDRIFRNWRREGWQGTFARVRLTTDLPGGAASVEYDVEAGG